MLSLLLHALRPPVDTTTMPHSRRSPFALVSFIINHLLRS
jgi:hypothetical protein